MLVVDVDPDPRRHPRYGVACKVGLEVPGTELGAFAGILEDLSAGGMRVRTPVQLSPDQRVFVSIELPEAPPIQALAEVRGMHHRGSDDEFVARLQFTFMSSLHQGRLEALLEWPAAELGSMAQDNSRPAVALGGPT
jgi:c-di-GMP-binding flagellar brake protein YcgR